MKYRVADSLGMQTVYFVLFTFWRATGLMLIGMALFKLDVFRGRLPASAYWTMVLVAVFLGIPLILYGTYRDFAAKWDFRYSFFYGMQFNYWASLLVSLAWVGAVMLACRSRRVIPLTGRLASVGRMAFTNYILETVACTTIFFGHGALGCLANWTACSNSRLCSPPGRRN